MAEINKRYLYPVTNNSVENNEWELFQEDELIIDEPIIEMINEMIVISPQELVEMINEMIVLDNTEIRNEITHNF